MPQTDNTLQEIESRAGLLSEAYRDRLSSLWWANLVFVVLPATLTAVTAVLAAANPPQRAFGMPIASVFALVAGVLIAFHKGLRCDEHQAECLRLCQAYASIAIAAGSALSASVEKRAAEQDRLSVKMALVIESAKARLPLALFEKPKTESA
jgi:hypothetical protein